MSAFPSLPLFTDAYIADTAHLTNEEHGAYLRLLMFAWRSPECRLPDNDARLARMLGLSAGKWAKIKAAVMAFWSLEHGFWTQKRLAKEHQFVTKKVEQKRANGKQGGRPKSLKDNDQPKANGSQIKTETKAPTPTPTNTPKVPKGTEPEGFAEWWEAYPQRDGANPRAAALQRYEQALKAGATPGMLMRAIRAYAAELQRTGKLGTEFVKQAQFFLSPRERRWEDYARQADSRFASPAASLGDAYLASLSDDRWRDEVKRWADRRGYWPLQNRTAPPDDPRTKVPSHILAEMNIHPARARAA